MHIRIQTHKTYKHVTHLNRMFFAEFKLIFGVRLNAWHNISFIYVVFDFTIPPSNHFGRKLLFCIFCLALYQGIYPAKQFFFSPPDGGVIWRREQYHVCQTSIQMQCVFFFLFPPIKSLFCDLSGIVKSVTIFYYYYYNVEMGLQQNLTRV